MYKLFEHIKKNYIALLLYAFLIVFAGLIQTQKSNYHLDEILTLNLSNGVFPNYFKPLKVYQPTPTTFPQNLSSPLHFRPLKNFLSSSAFKPIFNPIFKHFYSYSYSYLHLYLYLHLYFIVFK